MINILISLLVKTILYSKKIFQIFFLQIMPIKHIFKSFIIVEILVDLEQFTRL